MGTISFGTKQFNKPTPNGLSNAIQIYTVIASVVLAWMGTANFIPVHSSSVIQSILGLTIAVANGLKPFFGVTTDQKTVPIEQVGEMEAKKP